jgi:hypothetical protein
MIVKNKDKAKCPYCGKVKKIQYPPYCSFHYQEWARINEGFKYLNSLKQKLKEVGRE